MTATKTRSIPKLAHHKKLDLAYVAWRVGGKRTVRYLGKWGSRTAKVRYGTFCLCWPAPLTETRQSSRKWPARRPLTFNGKTQSVKAWASETGIKATTIRFRLSVRRWSVEEALTTPAKKWTRQAVAPLELAPLQPPACVPTQAEDALPEEESNNLEADAEGDDKNTLYDRGYAVGEGWSKQQTRGRLARWDIDRREARTATDALPREVPIPEDATCEPEHPYGRGGAWAEGFCDGAARMLA